MLVVPLPSERWTTMIGLVGELDARVVVGDPRIVPLGDLAEEDVGHVFGGELQPLGDAGEVVGDDHRAHHGRDVDESCRGPLSVPHR